MDGKEFENYHLFNEKLEKELFQIRKSVCLIPLLLNALMLLFIN